MIDLFNKRLQMFVVRGEITLEPHASHLFRRGIRTRYLEYNMTVFKNRVQMLIVRGKITLELQIDHLLRRGIRTYDFYSRCVQEAFTIVKTCSSRRNYPRVIN